MISKAVEFFTLHFSFFTYFLPVSYRSVEYLVYQVFDNLGYQFFLHRGKALSGVVGLGRCKLFSKSSAWFLVLVKRTFTVILSSVCAEYPSELTDLLR